MPPSNIYKNLAGTLNTIFQFGLSRPQIRSLSTGELEVRNAADSDFAVLRVATPVGDNDAVTKLYADTLEKPIVVSRQADTSVSLPANTGVRGFVVVTTAGSGAAIGDLLYDDGSGAGTMTILPAVEGRTIAVTDALSGGTVSFDPDSIYIWDEDGSAWIKIGDIGSVTGAVRTIRYTINNAAAQDSTFEIPANNRIVFAQLEVTTAYSGGATIEIGNTTTSDLFMGTAQNNPQLLGGIYTVEQDTDQGGTASVVRTTIGGAPAAGDGVVLVMFTSPNA
ncbi:MAG: hypothetical protein AAGM67_09655 [Bacteroidota bacterium]